MAFTEWDRIRTIEQLGGAVQDLKDVQDRLEKNPKYADLLALTRHYITGVEALRALAANRLEAEEDED